MIISSLQYSVFILCTVQNIYLLTPILLVDIVIISSLLQAGDDEMEVESEESESDEETDEEEEEEEVQRMAPMPPMPPQPQV